MGAGDRAAALGGGPPPERLVVVTGTGTGIGKTWVGAALARHLRSRGLRVALRKPAQSFAPGEAPETTDAAILAAAGGDRAEVVCPPQRWYPVPMAPPMAAAALGLPPFTIGDLRAEIAGSWPAGAPTDVGLVEGAGGVAAPQAGDGDIRELIAALRPGLVLLVADAGLGTINLVRFSAQALAGWPLAVYCNHFDPSADLHRRNRDWLAERCGLDVIVDIGQLAARVAAVQP